MSLVFYSFFGNCLDEKNKIITYGGEYHSTRNTSISQEIIKKINLLTLDALDFSTIRYLETVG